MFIALSIIIIYCILLIAFFMHPQFGRRPCGDRLERIKRSSNYRKGAFQNISPTPVMAEGTNFFQVFREFLFTKNRKPKQAVPIVKTDLKNLDPGKDILIWFGHSSCFIQIDGKKILVDPVLNSNVSPVPFTMRAFKGADPFTTDDIPEIDYLFITHDHWDHLDYKTLRKLKPKIKKIICGLGTASHLERWGFDTKIISEADWYERIILDEGFEAHTVPARHFSGRGMKRNQTLWTSFAFITPSMKFFFGSDGGYDTHFAEAGKTFNGFDLAILENGQYNKNWKFIHMSPDEVLKAAQDLRATRVLPVHSGKFSLSVHTWDEPLKKITELNKATMQTVITPVIGEPVNLKDFSQPFSKWWEEIH
ncbi:MAG: MBL fold metallo-hydrolase [Bacteroidota bacterium]